MALADSTAVAQGKCDGWCMRCSAAAQRRSVPGQPGTRWDELTSCILHALSSSSALPASHLCFQTSLTLVDSRHPLFNLQAPVLLLSPPPRPLPLMVAWLPLTPPPAPLPPATEALLLPWLRCVAACVAGLDSSMLLGCSPHLLNTFALLYQGWIPSHFLPFRSPTNPAGHRTSRRGWCGHRQQRGHCSVHRGRLRSGLQPGSGSGLCLQPCPAVCCPGFGRRHRHCRWPGLGCHGCGKCAGAVPLNAPGPKGDQHNLFSNRLATVKCTYSTRAPLLSASPLPLICPRSVPIREPCSLDAQLSANHSAPTCNLC